jgi:hypothetical protein
MMYDTFTYHLGLSPQFCDSLMARPLSEVLALPAVQALLTSLNVALLRQTLPTAGSILAQHLPLFYDWLHQELNVDRVPDSPEHATKWVVNFLGNQESLDHLVELHAPVPRPALELAIPRLVNSFDSVEDDPTRQEWQKAVSLLCLVLAIAAHEKERLQATSLT